MTTPQQLSTQEQDILRLVKSRCHIGNTNVNSSMERFIVHRTTKGVPIFDVMQTYNKIKLAARVIAAVKNPQDVIVSACLTR